MKHLPFLILLFLGYFSVAQNPYLTSYDSRNGLSSSETYDIIQDEFGYLWISGDKGLNRFDGYNFNHYDLADGLPDNTVFNFFTNASGEIWCSTYSNQLFKISGKSPVFEHYKFNDSLKKYGDPYIIEYLYLNSDSELFVSFICRPGYLKIDSQGNVDDHIRNIDEWKLNTIYYSHCTDQVHGNLILRMDTTSNKKLEGFNKIPFPYAPHQQNNRIGLIGFESNLRHFIYNNNDLLMIKQNQIDTLLFADEFRKIVKFDDEIFGVTTVNDGVYIFNKEGVLQNQLFKGESVNSVYLAHDGSIWAATSENGVLQSKKSIVSHKLIGEDIYQIEVFRDTSLLVTTENGYYFELNKKNEVVKSIETQLARKIEITYLKNVNDVYLSTASSIYRNGEFLMNKGGVGKVVFSPFDDAQDTIKLITRNGVRNYSQKGIIGELMNFSTRLISGDYFNNELYVWGLNGLHKIKNNQQTRLKNDPEILHTRINSVVQFNDYLVAGSQGKGIIFYKDGKTSSMNKALGLNSNFISEVYVENDTSLWVCTNLGINLLVFTQDSPSIYSMNINDGLLSNETSSIRVKDDTVWVGSNKGLSYFAKKDLLIKKEAKETPWYLTIDLIRINDEELVDPTLNCFSYDQNRLAFEFKSIQFDPNYEVKYRYKLLEIEQNWNYTSSRKVVYPDLRPDTYSFILQSSNEAGIWSDQVIYKFEITPPFWRTWWFIGLIILISIGVVALFFKFRILIYNGDLLREIMRQILKKLNKGTLFIIVRESGEDVKIATNTILFVRSDGNYLEIHTEKGKHTIREKIGSFLDLVPDPIEFIRVRRSYIVRLDKITQKGKKHLMIQDHKIEVGETYLKELQKIQL